MEQILANARRLKEDSDLLLSRRRFASCCLIQFFCLEEIVKFAIVRYSIKIPEKRFHIAKQRAGLALSASRKSSLFLQQLHSQLDLPDHGPLIDDDVDPDTALRSYGGGRLHAWLRNGGLDEFQSHIKEVQQKFFVSGTGIFEYFRKVSIYVDSNPSKPAFLEKPLLFSDFCESWAIEMNEVLIDAIEGIADRYAVAIFSEVYRKMIDGSG